MLTQPFFMRKAQTFPSPGFVITQSFRIAEALLQSFRIFRLGKYFRYGKVTVLSFPTTNSILFHKELRKHIANDPVRIVNAVINLNY